MKGEERGREGEKRSPSLRLSIPDPTATTVSIGRSDGWPACPALHSPALLRSPPTLLPLDDRPFHVSDILLTILFRPPCCCFPRHFIFHVSCIAGPFIVVRIRSGEDRRGAAWPGVASNLGE